MQTTPSRRERRAETDTAQEADPRTVGVPPAATDAIWSSVLRLYDTGTQPAIALCLRRRGKTILDRAVGFARPGVAATTKTPFCVFSVSKAITAMVVHMCDGRNLLRLDDPVCEYIPEFAQNGKRHVTIRHVLTHRAGIPSVAGHNDPSLLEDWDRIVRLLCEAKPTWPPGRRLAYHAITGGYVLGEIVRRVTGKDIRDVLRDEIARPLGLERLSYGVPPADVDLVARNTFTGPRVPPGLAHLVKRALGVGFEEAVEISNDRRFITACVPSGNVYATANELATFFQLLLDGGAIGDVRIFDRRTVKRALVETSYLELDLTLALPVRYGLGLMLAGPRISPFGPRTPHAFGHYGFINVVGWADPERDLAAALLTSGKPFIGPHLVPFWNLLATIAREIPRDGLTADDVRGAPL
jgi:CubicO group peptidase (beta-lactamase class C family)